MQSFRSRGSSLGKTALASGDRVVKELTSSQAVGLYSAALFHGYPDRRWLATKAVESRTKQTKLVREFSTKNHGGDDETSGFEKFMKRYWKTKQSTLQRDKDAHVTKAIPELIDLLGKRHPINVGVMAEMLITASYLPVSTNSSFAIKRLKDAGLLFPGVTGNHDVTFELVDQWTQRLLPADLADLPWDVEPGTAVQIWNVAHSSKLCKLAVFRGTNSVGSSRDAMLSHYDGTGALANGATGEVGANVVPYWLTIPNHPLAKYLRKTDVVIGHSLGAAFAQDYVEAILKTTGKAPVGYFASSPGRGRPPIAPWTEYADRWFFTRSKHDLVPRSGIYDWPGQELSFNLLDAPILPGLVDNWGDRWVIQHGSLISTMKLLKHGELVWHPREGTRLSTAIAPLDELDPGPFGYEIVDLLRPSVAKRLFTPTLIEAIMRQLAEYKIDAYFGKGKNPKRGLPYGVFVHLVAEFMGSEICAMYLLFHPGPTLQILLSSYNDLIRNDDTDHAISSILDKLLTIHSDPPLPLIGETSSEWRARVKQLVRDARQSFQRDHIAVFGDKQLV